MSDSKLDAAESAGSSAGGDSNIQVVVRVRPLSFNERLRGDSTVVFPSGEAGVRLQPPDGDADLSTRRGALGAPRGDSTFLVDFAFWEHNSNADVYAAVGRQCLEHAFTGYNSTVFAYGQTGSGKTHTMMGDPSSEVASMGLIPRLSMELFDEIARRGNRAQVSVSYVEIYGQQEALRDLLDPSDRPLRVKQSSAREFVVDGLTSYHPHTATELEMLIRAGSERRATGGTAMNDQSSRSHAMFIITLTQFLGAGDDATKRTSRLKLVDLAGSENLNKSKAAGQRQQEAMAINSALSTLKRVLNALVKRTPHIPFRDSVLTRLLADSVGGNSRTTMIATVSPAAYNADETKNTLVWACKARRITNKAVVNEDNERLRMKRLEQEVARLKQLLAQASSRSDAAGAAAPGLSEEAEREMTSLRLQLQKRQQELDEEMARKAREEKARREEEERTRLRIRQLGEQYAESQESLGHARNSWMALSKALNAAEERLRDALAENERLCAELRGSEEWQWRERARAVEEKEMLHGSLDERAKALDEREAQVGEAEAALEEASQRLQLQQRELQEWQERLASASHRGRAPREVASTAQPVPSHTLSFASPGPSTPSSGPSCTPVAPRAPPLRAGSFRSAAGGAMRAGSSGRKIASAPGTDRPGLPPPAAPQRAHVRVASLGGEGVAVSSAALAAQRQVKLGLSLSAVRASRR